MGLRRMARRLTGRKLRRQSNSITASILVVLLLPTLTFYFGASSSMALGTALAAVIVVLIQAAGRTPPPKNMGGTASPRRVFALLACLFGIVVLHLLAASLLSTIQWSRALLSLLPLGLTVAASAALAQYLSAAPSPALHRALMRCFIALCVVALLGMVGLAPPSFQTYTKPVFPFTEPSHFALAFTPLLLYASVTSTGRWRMVCLLVGFAFAALLQNLTLVVSCMLAMLTSLRFGRTTVLVVVLAATAAQLDLTYFASRLDFTAENQNLSALVYLQGWQLIGESWKHSAGIGLGFQQLGTQGTEVDAAQLIQAVLGDNLNVLDGGFTLAKLASELGFLGVGICGAYLVVAWRSWRVLHNVAFGAVKASPVEAFAHCAIVGYLVEMFVRGGGYFTATGFLLLTGLWLTARRTAVVRKPPRKRSTRRIQHSPLGYETDH